MSEMRPCVYGPDDGGWCLEHRAKRRLREIGFCDGSSDPLDELESLREKVAALEKDLSDKVFLLAETQAGRTQYNAQEIWKINQRLLEEKESLVSRAEKAESLLAAMTKERDVLSARFAKFKTVGCVCDTEMEDGEPVDPGDCRTCRGVMIDLLEEEKAEVESALKSAESLLADRTREREANAQTSWNLAQTVTELRNKLTAAESRATAQALAAAGLREALRNNVMRLRAIIPGPGENPPMARIEGSMIDEGDAALSKFPATPDEARVKAMGEIVEAAKMWRKFGPEIKHDYKTCGCEIETNFTSPECGSFQAFDDTLARLATLTQEKP